MTSSRKILMVAVSVMTMSPLSLTSTANCIHREKERESGTSHADCHISQSIRVDFQHSVSSELTTLHLDPSGMGWSQTPVPDGTATHCWEAVKCGNMRLWILSEFETHSLVSISG